MKSPEELFAEAARFEEGGCEQEALQKWKDLSEQYQDPDALFRFALLAKKLDELGASKKALDLLVKLHADFDGAHLTLAS